GLEQTIKKCIADAGTSVSANIKAVSVDTTGSTPVATDETGIPLALFPEFENNPNAMFVLWKDHTSVKEAAEINEHNKTFSEDYLKYVGGIYSSEWFWAKLLHVLRHDADVRKACYSWVEHCDWIPFLLTDGKHVASLKRGVCSAGHKALWAAEFGGLPPNDFFSLLDPLLEGFTQRLFKRTFTADKVAGNLSQHWAERLGLSTDVIVGVGAFDAHMGAVGGQIEPYHLSKVMGTSTCDMLVAPVEDMQGKLVKGICGQVDGSIIPRMIRALVEATCFGAKKIVDRFTDEGIQIKGLIGLGGVARKSPFIMQTMANVINKPLRIHKSEQTCAAGAAMFAATAAGVYSKVEDAMVAMGRGFDAEYFPDAQKTAIYAKRYSQYSDLGNFIEQQIAMQNQPNITSHALTEY